MWPRKVDMRKSYTITIAKLERLGNIHNLRGDEMKNGDKCVI